jgi:hypothetical protein
MASSYGQISRFQTIPRGIIEVESSSKIRGELEESDVFFLCGVGGDGGGERVTRRGFVRSSEFFLWTVSEKLRGFTFAELVILFAFSNLG